MRPGQQLVGPETTLEQLLRARERLDRGVSRAVYVYPDCELPVSDAVVRLEQCVEREAEEWGNSIEREAGLA